MRGSFGAALQQCDPGAAWYVAAPAGPLHLVFCRVLRDLDIWRRTLIWLKGSFVMGRGDYHYRHEPLLYGWTPGARHYFIDDRTQDSVFEFDRPLKSVDHPTVKPVGLVAKCIHNSSREGWLCFDPFCGSGTTLIAAEKLGRRCYGIEIEPKYCDVIVERWQNLTGKKAKRA